VDASGRAELYGTTDRSIDPDRFVYRSQISILEASTPNLLIVQDLFVSLLRAPLPCLEHWWMPRAGLSFMALQTDRFVCRSRISILEASTPNVLIVQDPFMSLLRAPMPWLEHWWMPRAGLSFMALQTDRSIPIDWSVGAGSRSIGLYELLKWICIYSSGFKKIVG
jgi:hypothetical protein